MLVVKNFEVMGVDHAIRGMRNPLASWAKSDSFYNDNNEYVIGDNDEMLMGRLAKAGTDHRKYLRQIAVYMDVEAPLYWWKQFDQYKIGVTTNSESTMHCIHKQPFGAENFSIDTTSKRGLELFNYTLIALNQMRDEYIETQDKKHWLDIIQFLPSSFNQTRTVSLNYEVLLNIYFARRNHKLYEWKILCQWIETLPMMETFIKALSKEVV